MAEFKGRPGSAGQRPTGGDKAMAGQKKQYFRRKKVCRFCVERIDDINYKDVKLLHGFVAERGKIIPRRISGVCAPTTGGCRRWTVARQRPHSTHTARESKWGPGDKMNSNIAGGKFHGSAYAPVHHRR
jgi:small subunit ribosomal protein S18